VSRLADLYPMERWGTFVGIPEAVAQMDAVLD
jgi:hypothetical protein